MEEKQIEELVEKAHKIFDKTSIYEVMDLDRDAAIMTLLDYYGAAHKDTVEKYLSILDQIREFAES